jgi:hypothetical protein
LNRESRSVRDDSRVLRELFHLPGALRQILHKHKIQVTFTGKMNSLHSSVYTQNYRMNWKEYVRNMALQTTVAEITKVNISADGI